MILYFVRHGQTDYNLNNLIQGQQDIPLNETGIRQAEQTRELLRAKGIGYDMIYCSPLSRAIVTGEIVSGQSRDTFHFDKRLAEIKTGDIDHASILTDDPYIVDFVKHPDRFVPHPGAESYQDMIDRVGSFLDEMKETQPAEKILVTCHRGPIQSVIMNIDKSIPLKDFRRISIPNASCLEVEWKDGAYHVNHLYRNDDNKLPDEQMFF